MKRTIIAVVVSLIVLGTAALWFFKAKDSVTTVDVVTFGVIVVLVGFGLYFAYRRLSSAHRGEPAEDELSKKVMQKTAAWSYYVSIYMWVFMGWFKDRVALDTEEVIGAGILCMAVIFFICWIIIRLRGIRNE